MTYLKRILSPLTLCVVVAFIVSIHLSGCKSETKNVANPKTESEIISIAKKIHSEAIVLDAHADIATPTTAALYLGADGTSKVTLPKLVEGGVDVVVMSVAVDPGARTPEAEAEARRLADQELQIVLDLVDESDGKIVLAKSTADIISASESLKNFFILGFQNARALEKRVDAINEFYDAGVRVFALTHIGNNDFADSSRPAFDGDSGVYELAEHGGLSDLGKQAIQRINKLGALVDVSQLSKQATLQVLEISKAPVVATHSNVRSISDVSRNLSDEEIDLIGKTGGVIHVSPFRAYMKDYSDEKFLSDIRAVRREAGISETYSYPFELYWEIDDPKAKMDFLLTMSDLIGPAFVPDLVDHIDYIVGRIGIDHVGIGTDFNHGAGIEGFQEASDALNVTIELVRRGYSQEDIEKIWSDNFLRVFAQAEKLKTED